MGIKEPFNSISHIVGGVLSLALLPIMALRASGTMAVATAVIYGGTLVAMYTLSVLYHSIPHERAEPWLFRLDQVGIYLLIAGTYTPVSLLVVGGTAGWVLFGVEWVLAAAGIALLLTVPRAPQVLHQVAYIALGWAAVVVLPILLALPMSGLALLVVGGILYTAGSYLYNRDRRGTIGRLGDHELWHLRTRREHGARRVRRRLRLVKSDGRRGQVADGSLKVHIEVLVYAHSPLADFQQDRVVGLDPSVQGKR